MMFSIRFAGQGPSEAEAHVKLPGWIKSVVEFVKIPAIARQAGPPSRCA